MEWRVVLIGAKNGDAAFPRILQDLLGPVRDRAELFLDDIIISSGTDLRRVLDMLDRHKMLCQPTKASLYVKEVAFAGHVVRHRQQRPMPGKLAALNHSERHGIISELRSLMGFCNYHSGYVQMYAELSGPFHKMLQVGKFHGRKGGKKKLAWTTEAE